MTTADRQLRGARQKSYGPRLPGLPARIALVLMLAFVPGAGRAAEPLSLEPTLFAVALPPPGSGIAGDAARPVAQFTLARWSIDAPEPAYVGTTALSEQMIGWMAHEAQRYRQGNLFIAPGPLEPASADTEEQRAGAERIITRALRRTVTGNLEELARTTLGLGPAWRWIEDFGSGTRDSATPPDTPPAQPGAGADRDRPHASIGLRMDAHPRLLLRATFLGVQARLEVPVRNEPVRLSLTRRLGSIGQASLSAGRSPDGDDWASLGLRLKF